MEKNKSVRILEQCIALLENMSQEEFDRLCVEKGIDEKVYETRNYIDENMRIILPE